MALQKTIIDNKGQTVEYHRIIEIKPVFETGKEALFITFASYTSEVYREKEKTEGERLFASLTTVALNLVDDYFSRSNIYERLKLEIDVFKDAVDC